ncbi:hypothetical protein [Alsobacter soli]|uniref:hypothetical protein n=1 Tax=Alsobacter soli TaxID=2109933 RepID=UPI001304EE93|nr:hypothetical protein [Alsobacter soli]
MAQPAQWEASGEAGRSGLRVSLWLGAAAAVVVAGLLLWAAQGEAVFTDVVSAALAWCF